ncbi:MAG: glycosyltransferase family 2 protein [Proteobacteria bacterium]|nr:glycosyltransferase family 2 protein [Pseudomonadota bacterium]
MQTLSVVIITLNEEANIRDCLESVVWADEIIVMDSGSTDRTVEICREYTDRVVFREWEGYSPQRNAVIGMARGDWVLSLDADERVTPELAVELRSLLARSDDAGPDGYWVPYKVFYRGRWLRHGGFYPDSTLRLHRLGRGGFGERAVHESLQIDGPIGRMRGHLEHHTYRSVSDYLDRMQIYTDLSAQEYLRQGRRTGPIRMSLRAAFTFFNMYVVKAGFLDGYEGFLMAVLYSVYTFTKYAKLKELAGDGPDRCPDTRTS